MVTVPETAVTINQDTALQITGSHVSDPDAGDVQTAIISVLHGTLTLQLDPSTISTLGLTVTGDGTGSITIVGPTGALNAAAVDAALNAGFIYTPNDEYTGGDTLTIKDTRS